MGHLDVAAVRLLIEKFGQQSSVPREVVQRFQALLDDLLARSRDKVDQDDEQECAARREQQSIADACAEENIAKAAKALEALADSGADAGAGPWAGQPLVITPKLAQMWDYPLSRDEKMRRLHQLWDLECVAAEEVNRKTQARNQQLSHEYNMERRAVALEDEVERSAASVTDAEQSNVAAKDEEFARKVKDLREQFMESPDYDQWQQPQQELPPSRVSVSKRASDIFAELFTWRCLTPEEERANERAWAAARERRLMKTQRPSGSAAEPRRS